MSDFHKWLWPRVIGCGFLLYAVVTFCMWDFFWMTGIPDWRISDRLFFLVIGSGVWFLLFWFPFGMRFLREIQK